MVRFLAVLRSFFHSSLLYTLSFHPFPPTSLPSSRTSSCHPFLGLPLSLVSKFIYNAFLRILLTCICLMAGVPTEMTFNTTLTVKLCQSIIVMTSQRDNTMRHDNALPVTCHSRCASHQIMHMSYCSKTYTWNDVILVKRSMIFFSSTLCMCPNQHNLFNLIVSVIVGFFLTLAQISLLVNLQFSFSLSYTGPATAPFNIRCCMFRCQ